MVVVFAICLWFAVHVLVNKVQKAYAQIIIEKAVGFGIESINFMATYHFIVLSKSTLRLHLCPCHPLFPEN